VSIDLFSFKPPKMIVSWDKQCAGLGIRLNPKGKRVYIVKYRVAGDKQYQKTLCPTELITLEQARKAVLRIKTLARHGQDPSKMFLDCLELKVVTTSATVAKFCKIYMDKHAKVHKKSWKKDLYLIEKYILPEFGNRTLSSINRLEISTFHAVLGKKSIYTANRVIELLQVILKYAALWGFLPETEPNQARGIKMFRERCRDRFVTTNEMPSFIRAVLEYPDKVYRIAILLDLHLGLRSSELISLRWSYFDLDQRVLRIPDTKNGKPHVLPITKEVEELLKKLPRSESNPFVFPGRFKGTHISRFDAAFRVIKRNAGLNDVRPHDLRRTAGSWINNNGASLHMTGRILNQTTQQVTAVYARHDLAPISKVLSDHSKQLNSISEAVEQVLHHDAI